MDSQYRAYFERVAESATVPAYAKEYFDHLYNEYLALPPESIPLSVQDRVADIVEKRQKDTMKWSDIYGFDLLLVELLPFRVLVQKAFDMRAKYRSVAGQRDYETYLATRPPDLTLTRGPEPNANAGGGGATPPNVVTSPPLTSPPFTSPPLTSPPPPPVTQPGPVTVESLRADLRYLLGQFYLYYALLPYREGFRDEITRRARNMTYIFLGIFTFAVIMASLEEFGVSGRVFRVPTILIVVLTGIIGGCISMLQRIQSAPAEGDAIYNLASLTNGWKGMSLAPLYGAVFAMLFYMLFAAGVVKGVVFPEVHTPTTFAAPTPSPEQTPTPVPTPTPDQTAASTTPPTPTPTPTPAPEVKRPPSIFWRFTDNTYPLTGKDYALLIVWAFLAGFLERLVPDALNRLVLKNQLIEGKTT